MVVQAVVTCGLASSCYQVPKLVPQLVQQLLPQVELVPQVDPQMVVPQVELVPQLVPQVELVPQVLPQVVVSQLVEAAAVVQWALLRQLVRAPAVHPELPMSGVHWAASHQSLDTHTNQKHPQIERLDKRTVSRGPCLCPAHRRAPCQLASNRSR